jgi:acetoin utilization protein AcuB
MIVSEITSTDIFPLKKTDTCESVLVFMQDWKVFHLPVVDNGKLVGYVTVDDLNSLKGNLKIEKYIIPNPQLFLLKTQHLFEVVQQFAETKYTCLAVCDVENNYQGAVSLTELNQAFNNSSLIQPGAIIVLRMNPKDYSLAELSRIIEYNDSKIVNVFVHTDFTDNTKIMVSLKLNKKAISTVLQTLERYQYNIHSIHQFAEQNADVNDRYDWLIKYIHT